MKKQIEALLKNNGLISDSFSTLSRWTKDALGSEVDRLELRINPVGGVEFSKCFEIAARDADGVVTEVSERTAQAFAEIGEEIARMIKNGVKI